MCVPLRDTVAYPTNGEADGGICALDDGGTDSRDSPDEPLCPGWSPRREGVATVTAAEVAGQSTKADGIHKVRGLAQVVDSRFFRQG